MAARRTLVTGLGLLAALGFAAAADAGPRSASHEMVVADAAPPAKSSSHRRRTQVRGYVARRGGYSYFPEDTINTYGDSRTKYGGANTYRDPMLDRQTISGPFDHGFFFDSGIGSRGGDSPYMN